MIRRGVTILIGLLLLGTGAAAQEPATPEGHRERLGYALGMNYWQRLQDLAVEVDPEFFIRGFRDAQSGSTVLLSEAELRTVLDTLQAELRQRQQAGQAGSGQPAGSVKLREIQAAFKLDPHLTRSLYMGDRWISRPVFTGVRQHGDVYTLEARAHGIDARGGQVRIQPEWLPSDPEMVQVSPVGEDGTVRITVTRPGESTLRVAAHGISRELAIRATHDGMAMQVEITQ
jgi:hypothetical protein